MTITAIEEQKKRKDRVNIFIDSQFAFGLKIDLVWEHHLKVGTQLTQDQINTIQAQDAESAAYDKALTYLAARPRSTQEVRQHLRDKLIYKHPDYAEQTDLTRPDFIDHQQHIIEDVLAQLVDRGLLSDVAFAKWWIQNRQTFRPRGKRMLLLELKAKGISNQDLETALTTPNPEGHFHSEVESHSETDAALTVAQAYLRKHPGFSITTDKP